MTLRAFIIILSLTLAYIGPTWFFYGSAHPCKILAVRQKDYYVELAKKRDEEDFQSWKVLALKALPATDYDRFVRNLEDYSNAFIREDNLQRSVALELRQKIREMTPAQCAWQAVTWQAPR